MGIKYGKDYQYAERSLAGTVVFHDGMLMEVRGIRHRDGTVVATDLSHPNSGRTFDINLDLMDLRPFQLGYVNAQGQAFYLMRKPSRQWRQGTVRNNIGYCYRGAYHHQCPIQLGENVAELVKSNYPSLETIENLFQHKLASSVAFSRTWALERSDDRRILCRRGWMVGELKGGKPYFKGSNTIYEQELEGVFK